MNVSGLLTSAGINIALCTALSSLYSVLRKQPGNVSVYFGQRFAQVQSKDQTPFCFDRLVPSPSWILEAWETSEEDLLEIGGLDAVVFFRIVVFSIRVFSIAAVICIFLVLPLNYFGQAMHHQKIRAESLEVFTIGNVKEGSRWHRVVVVDKLKWDKCGYPEKQNDYLDLLACNIKNEMCSPAFSRRFLILAGEFSIAYILCLWLWAHCLALYIISCCACALLYIESKSIAKMRMTYIAGTREKLSRFTVLVRAIPWSGESYSDSVTKFFTNYYSSSYLSHQMVYLPGTVRKLVNDAEKMYNMLKYPNLSQQCGSSFVRCGLCGVSGKPFRILSKGSEIDEGSRGITEDLREKECAAALVFFRTRYAALVAAQALQSPNPMLWVTDLAPEPPDVFWANLCVPYRLLWVRRIGTLIASLVFMVFFFVPVSFVQGLVHLEKLKEKFSFVRKLSDERNFIFDMVTGYLPSVMLMLFLYIVPPIMMTFSAVEGPIARSGRKISACVKVLYFLIWNVFFSNILSGSVLERFDTITSLKDIPLQLAGGVPSMAVFFMAYVLTSGWTGLAFELMQPFVLLCNWLDRCLFRGKDLISYGPMTFPYHTEIPRVLLFGLLGFTASVTAPLILPFLMVYFFLAYLIYRNQFINVYVTKYETGGLYWPIAHNAIIFSLLLMQTIVLGVFGIKKAPIASGFTIPLIICTLLFHIYCTQRFLPSFKNNAAQIVMEMDRQDEQSGKLEEIHQQLHSAYCQFKSTTQDSSTAAHLDEVENGRQMEEIGDRLRSAYCSFKSTSYDSPIAGNLDQFENGDDHRLQDSKLDILQ